MQYNVQVIIILGPWTVDCWIILKHVSVSAYQLVSFSAFSLKLTFSSLRSFLSGFDFNFFLWAFMFSGLKPSYIIQVGFHHINPCCPYSGQIRPTIWTVWNSVLPFSYAICTLDESPKDVMCRAVKDLIGGSGPIYMWFHHAKSSLLSDCDPYCGQK